MAKHNDPNLESKLRYEKLCRIQSEKTGRKHRLRLRPYMSDDTIRAVAIRVIGGEFVKAICRHCGSFLLGSNAITSKTTIVFVCSHCWRNQEDPMELY